MNAVPRPSLITRWKAVVARQIDVPVDAGKGAWVVRLFFRKPAAGKRDLAMLWSRALGRQVRAELSIAPDDSTRTRIRRLFFRPLRRRGRLEADLRRARHHRGQHRRSMLLGRIGHWFKPVTGAFATTHRTITSHLPGVPWDAIGARVDTWSSVVDRVPFLRTIILLAAAAVGVAFWTTPLPLADQFNLFIAVCIVMFIARRIPGRWPTMLMVSLSILMTGRYMWWRITQTLNFATPVEAIFGYLLFMAEIYTWIVLFFGYIQTAWPLNRHPKPLPANPDEWPTVDVYIPTYNEPLSVVSPTVLAAKSMDWPRDKLRIYILDDGSREEFNRFAAEVGVGYLTREEHRFAKAGNINHALKLTSGEFVAIFDCDHIPTRSFLQTTMGEFIADPKCSMVQTPHHFFSPDPFERNYDTFMRIPNEGSLFYGLIQDGNDFWNATFFCGSCAVIRRAPLEEVGGIAVETVTEDAHTSLKMHRHGYRSAYLRIVQAAGLATESLSGHIGQRIRWARGMAQIFRVDNPWIGKGLSFFQRICYSNAMLHFFYGIPRLVFLLMPCAYLFFGLHVFAADAVAVMAYVLPYLFVSGLANSRIQGRYRHSFWAEVYESVLAWYTVLPTTVAFINPKKGKFNVTAKGGLIEQEYLDWATSKPYVWLLGINIAALLAGVIRMFTTQRDEPATVLMNMVWAMFNVAMLGAAVGVAKELRQVRVSHHVPLRVPATLILADGRTVACRTENYSTGGLGIVLPMEFALKRGEAVGVSLTRGDADYYFSAMVARNSGLHLGLKFEDWSHEKETQLIQCTFGRADAWIRWDEELVPDSPLHSFVEVVEMGYQGVLRLFDSCLDAAEAVFVRRPRQPD
ncbi:MULTISPECIES: UDP-forming cellulose synthase catalytic subunit [Dyella]|uniref:Cellulose synthase catalytic subunit [UDP-forming] n=2 Tax=Dyella TaxID=231454 RepID=A0A4V2NMF0_9GAMM|nr:MULTISPECIES: UDP-forming cellulose synthase catalytic subunit [Dyella]TBR39355.1 UDP-forming cellulose synthase catalytic subunit [Dyella terrae]TCI13057.1 UDP-forming cellulose synthase catalytic subunit [Dyella soli]